MCLIEPTKLEDERGFFARSWDKEKLQELGLSSNLVQCNISFSKKKGTIRGMHYQISPYEESKIIRCTRGRIFDVILDLRKDSKTYKDWISFELSEENYKMLFVPEGCAHGFLTLEDNTEVFYQNTAIHMKEFEKGIKILNKFIKMNEHDVSAYILLAKIFLSMNYYIRAEEVIRKIDTRTANLIMRPYCNAGSTTNFLR